MTPRQKHSAKLFFFLQNIEIKTLRPVFFHNANAFPCSAIAVKNVCLVFAVLIAGYIDILPIKSNYTTSVYCIHRFKDNMLNLHSIKHDCKLQFFFNDLHRSLLILSTIRTYIAMRWDLRRLQDVVLLTTTNTQ